MDSYYKHSGRVPPISILVGLLTGILASIPLAWAYDYGIINIPSLKLRMFCTFFFGILVGAATGIGLGWGKLRNVWAAAYIGLLASLAALYISWIFWFNQLAHLNPAKLLASPEAVWKLTVLVNSEGTWAMEHDSPTSGTFLWFLWIAEAGTILLAGTFTAVSIVKRKPFCDGCDNWCGEVEKIYYGATVLPTIMKSRVEARDFVFLQGLPQGSSKAAHFRVDLHSCATCCQLSTLSVIKNLPKDRGTIVDKLLISETERELVGRSKQMTGNMLEVGS